MHKISTSGSGGPYAAISFQRRSQGLEFPAIWDLDFYPLLVRLAHISFLSVARDRHFFMLAVAFYGLSMIYSVFLWRKGFRQDNRVNYVLLLIAFGFHTSAMMLRGFSLNHCPVTNLYEATTFAEWTIAAVYLAVGLWSRLRFLGAFASPFLFGMGVFALMPGLDPPKGTFEAAAGTWTSLHAALMSLAYGAFGLSSVAALMYLTQEHNLKFHKLHAIFSLLPPIQRLEVIVVRTLFAGFILLTVGLLIGGYDLACTSNPQSHRGDPKIVWSALVWLLYLGLIIMRWKFAQGGRRFALGAIGSFAFVLLTFWGSNLLSPLHNPRAPTGPKEPTQAFYNHTRLGNATWQPSVSPIGSWVIALTKLDPAGHQPAIQPTTSRRYGGYVNRHRLAERPLKSCRSLFLG